MKTIAVLLTVFNRKEKTLECLNRIYNQEKVNNLKIEIYLTNDGCTDGTPDAVKGLYPDVKIINGNGNLFWNRGMYTAWKEAAKQDYDFYLWLNDDTYTYPYMLKSLIESSSLHSDSCIIVGATQDTNHQQATYGGRLSNGKIPFSQNSETEVHYFNGNIVLIPRKVFQVLGNLDYVFTHSKGDFDYGMRAKKIGIKMFQTASFLGECDLHESIDKWCDPNIPFKQRWKLLHRPNGMPPYETFHLEKRHLGLLTALFHYCTIHIRCIIPSLWIKLNKTQQISSNNN